MIEVLSADPRILLIHDFLSAEEARELEKLGGALFAPSRHTCDDPGGCVSSYRTSDSAYLPRTAMTDTLSRRACVAGLLTSDADPEPLQLVRYGPGQEFRPHLDTSDDSAMGEFARSTTLLVYLNDDFEGGETVFTKLGLTVRPRARAALQWRNILPSGKVDKRTEHAGLPVRRGEKLACNVWIKYGSPGCRRGSVDLVASRVAPLVTIGRMLSGSAGVSSPEWDRANRGVKIERIPYPLKAASTRMTLQRMGAMIRDAAVSPSMRQFSEMVVRQAGVGVLDDLSDRKAGQIFLDYVRRHVRYRPDPKMAEYVQDARITLCVPGAAMCIPVEDCDGLTVALGSLMAAYGMGVKLLKQTYDASAAEEHVLVLYEDGQGSDVWVPADPSAPPDRPVGWKSRAMAEVVVDPSDPRTLDLVGAPDAELVTVGRLGRGMLGVDPETVARDLQEEFTAVVLQADTLVSATPPEYGQAVTMYQAAGQVGAEILGPEIDSLSPGGATKSLTTTAWQLNAALALVNGSSTATAADAANASSYARQMLALYEQAIDVATRPPPAATGSAEMVIGVAAVAVAAGLGIAVWKSARSAPMRRARRRAA